LFRAQPEVQGLQNGGFSGQSHFRFSSHQLLNRANVVAVERIGHGDEDSAVFNAVGIKKGLAQETRRQGGRLHRHFLEFGRVNARDAELLGQDTLQVLLRNIAQV
jgi:hypothetical protein